MSSTNICHRFKSKNIALTFLRLGVGIVFIAEGWAKISNMQATIGFFNSIGFGSALAYFVTYVEFIGGILAVVGLMTGVTGVAFAIILLVAIQTVPRPFDQLYLEIVLFFSSLAMAFAGAGKYSLHRLVCKSCRNCTCASCHGDCKGCNVCQPEKK